MLTDQEIDKAWRSQDYTADYDAFRMAVARAIESAAVAPLLERIAELEAKLAQRVPDGWKLVPDWKGYALLGTGHYVINHTADFDEKLGAELLITLANEDDKSGNRQIGESRDVTDQKLIESDQMVIRIGFLNERGLFALEDQLRYIRQLHFAASPRQQQVQPFLSCTCFNETDRMYCTSKGKCSRVVAAAAPAAPEQQEPTKRCPNCDDTGDVHSIDGEWRGVCHCPAGQAINEQVKPSTNSIVQAAVIRALDEASVRNEVLRGMCLEVALEKARDMLEGLK